MARACPQRGGSMQLLMRRRECDQDCRETEIPWARAPRWFAGSGHERPRKPCTSVLGADSIDPRRAADQRGRDARPRTAEPANEALRVPPFPMFATPEPAPLDTGQARQEGTIGRSRSHPGVERTRRQEAISRVFTS